MSNMLTFLGKQKGAGSQVVKQYTCALSGSYANGGAIGVAGETLNFATALNPKYAARTKLPGAINGSIANLPANTAFTVPPLYGFTFAVERNAVSPNTTNYVLRIFASDGTELASGTYASVAAALVAAGAQAIVINVTVPLKQD